MPGRLPDAQKPSAQAKEASRGEEKPRCFFVEFTPRHSADGTEGILWSPRLSSVNRVSSCHVSDNSGIRSSGLCAASGAPCCSAAICQHCPSPAYADKYLLHRCLWDY